MAFLTLVAPSCLHLIMTEDRCPFSEALSLTALDSCTSVSRQRHILVHHAMLVTRTSQAKSRSPASAFGEATIRFGHPSHEVVGIEDSHAITTSLQLSVQGTPETKTGHLSSSECTVLARPTPGFVRATAVKHAIGFDIDQRHLRHISNPLKLCSGLAMHAK